VLIIEDLCGTHVSASVQMNPCSIHTQAERCVMVCVCVSVCKPSRTRKVRTHPIIAIHVHTMHSQGNVQCMHVPQACTRVYNTLTE